MAQFQIQSGQSVLVDDHDLHILRSEKFTYQDTGRNSRYVRRSNNVWVKGVLVPQAAYLHRMIMNAGPGDIVDHKSGDTLDNRRDNLRFVTWQQNAMNQGKKTIHLCTSKFKGVSAEKRSKSKPWQVHIRCGDGKHRHIGNFASEFEAAYHYDMASIAEHGVFGRRNFLPLAR